MPPKHKLILLSACTLILIAMLTWCIYTHNTVGMFVDIMVLLYYVPHYIFAIRDMKRGRK